MPNTNGTPPESLPVEPPRTPIGILRRIGPGIIITGSIVGSGELIVTTKLGAQVGFTLLWLIILSCIIKVFIQIEMGRHAIASGKTTLVSFDELPGPRFGAGWLVWLWAAMVVCTTLQLSGILFGVADVFAINFSGIPRWVWTSTIAIATSIILFAGRYRTVERSTTFMVFLFTAITLLAGCLLQTTADYAIGWPDLREGFSLKIPSGEAASGIITAFAAFGITGVGASELIYYPYWCLEKGYARYIGPVEPTDAWVQRARGWIRVMKVDAWLSMLIYTTGTVAFYLLGAAVLKRQGKLPQDDEMLDTLSRMYTATFGESLGMGLFLVGAFAVLYSTFFVSSASNCRLFTDALQIFRLVRHRDPERQARLLRIFSFALPIFCFLLQSVYPRPITLILIGAVAQASMLPFISLAAAYLRYRRTDRRLSPGMLSDIFLWIAVVTMVSIGIYQVMDRIF